MKSTVLFFLVFVLFSRCSAQKQSSTWVVTDVKTNYVQKGFKDVYELPTELKGKTVQLQDSLLILPEVRKRYVGSAIFDGFSDTIVFGRKMFFKKQEDDELSLRYPGNEFIVCVDNDEDTCLVGETFLNMLATKENGIEAYPSSTGRHSTPKCILFVLKENKKMILYSENDFLLLFLRKK